MQNYIAIIERYSSGPDGSSWAVYAAIPVNSEAELSRVCFQAQLWAQICKCRFRVLLGNYITWRTFNGQDEE